MSKRRRRKTIPEFRQIVAHRPLTLRAVLRDGQLRLIAVMHRKLPSALDYNSARVSVYLTKTQTQLLFKRLACGLGFALPGKLKRTMGPLTQAHDCPLGLFVPDKGPVHLALNVQPPKKAPSVALISAMFTVPRKNALALCKALAEPLGWELVEWWEEQAA